MSERIAEQLTRTWVIHPEVLSNRERRDPHYALSEAKELTRALPGLETVGAGIVRLQSVQPSTLFGSGKCAELKSLFDDHDIELVIIDGMLSPKQQQNLEKQWSVKILDRTSLILEIFSDRAATREGVVQVEMAALRYQRTRLVRAWTHLERQRGGLGFVGGPGETQIEADRRAIDTQLLALEKRLAKIVKTRDLHRKARAKVPFPIVALVGYTNAGKSTLFNSLTGATVMAKDMLFATLDPTMRSVELSNGVDVILSDTVGFISDLPTQLIAAFRATLEEVLSADLILHVRDMSHPEWKEQSKDVEGILEQLGLPESIPIVEVWNKADLLEEEAHMMRIQQASRLDRAHVISAITGKGMAGLLDEIDKNLRPEEMTALIKIAYAASEARAWFFENNLVVDEAKKEVGFELTVSWTAVQSAKFHKRFAPLIKHNNVSVLDVMPE